MKTEDEKNQDSECVQIDISNVALLRESILSLSENDIDMLINLDREGFLIGDEEDIESYKKRVLSLIDEKVALENSLSSEKSLKIDRSIILCDSMQLSLEEFDVSNKKLLENYGFCVNWSPSFYSPKSLGLFAGGNSIVFESGLSIILLNKAFRGRKKWLLYTKEELLTHELCHAARAPLNDNIFEEFFAYRLSPSFLRRGIGNCFRGDLTPVFLLGPIFLVLILQIVNIFLQTQYLVFSWVIIFIYPIFLTIRLLREQHIYNKAFKKLKSYTNKESSILSILFRCSYSDIRDISKLGDNSISTFINDKKKSSLRWKIIASRFL